MVDAGEGCIGWGARDRDLMRGTVHIQLWSLTSNSMRDVPGFLILPPSSRQTPNLAVSNLSYDLVSQTWTYHL